MNVADLAQRFFLTGLLGISRRNGSISLLLLLVYRAAYDKSSINDIIEFITLLMMNIRLLVWFN